MKAAIAVLGVIMAPALLWADEPSIDYTRDIRPLLRARCYSCHGALKQEASLRLDTTASMKRGGDSGPAIAPGDTASLLLERISATDESVRMPPEGSPLSAKEISQLTRWIQMGAPAPTDERPEEDPRQHWAFQRPVRPSIPSSSSSSDPAMQINPIDALIDRQRAALGVHPLPPTDKATLLRRVYLDLIGIPPSADEVESFLADTSPTAYEAVVDRLLGSPQHGERWARHWMDVWRYSDWYGRRSVPDVMNSYPMIWRWRDWIVRSLNEDKPYDEMIRQMLAADELTPGDDQNLVATGYLVRSWFKWNYETWKKDLVEHTGKAFLGLTLNCAQCHDHKYDPLVQEEYFRFRAFFEPLELRHDRVAGQPDPGPFVKYVYGQPYGPIKSGMVRVFDENLSAETFMFAKGDSRLRMEGKPPVSPGAPAVINGHQLSFSPITLPLEVAYPGMKPFIRAEEREKRLAAIRTAESDLAKAQESFASQPKSSLDELRAAEEGLTKVRAEVAQRLTTVPPQSRHVLQGTQSLVLDAKTGRRALGHAIRDVEPLSDQGSFSYQVRILQDGHTNIQLALDLAQGATGGFIAFEKGVIKTYAPGGFQEIGVGNYDLAKGQDSFQVHARFDFSKDRFLLTVRSLSDQSELVKEVAAALNGWRPQANGKRGLFVDCRPGTEAIYDDVCFRQPDGAPLVCFTFEPPDYGEGQDVSDPRITSSGGAWSATRFCQPPATSKISSAVSSDPAVQAALARFDAARQIVKAPSLKLQAAELQLLAANQELESLERRMDADSARFASELLAEDRKDEPAIKSLIAAAWQSEQQATLTSAKAALTSAEAALAAAELQIADATQRSDQAALTAANAALKTAQQQHANATTAVSTATANAAKEPGEYTPLSPKYPQVTTGRRAALAQWIASRENPLTARVAVNHLWLRHFGKAIVDTTHDFGRNGSRPSHPEVLDWLASELMDAGWSMKHVHRLIVTSQTYQLTSAVPQSQTPDANRLAQAGKLDPDNRTYWRFPDSRMQAEVVRDSLLAVAGELDTTMGGHELDQKLGLVSRRRSLYFAHHGEEKMEFLELFDAANPCDCYKRTSSVQPQQALALTNSELTTSLSRQLAALLWARACSSMALNTDPTGAAGAVDGPLLEPEQASRRYVEGAFLQVLNRPPRAQELAASLVFLEQQSRRLGSGAGVANGGAAEQRARENLVHALMNHNDFVTIR